MTVETVEERELQGYTCFQPLLSWISEAYVVPVLYPEEGDLAFVARDEELEDWGLPKMDRYVPRRYSAVILGDLLVKVSDLEWNYRLGFPEGEELLEELLKLIVLVDEEIAPNGYFGLARRDQFVGSVFDREETLVTLLSRFYWILRKQIKTGTRVDGPLCLPKEHQTEARPPVPIPGAPLGNVALLAGAALLTLWWINA